MEALIYWVGAPAEIPFSVPIAWHHPLDDGVPLKMADGTALTADEIALEAWDNRFWSKNNKDWNKHGLKCMCMGCVAENLW